MDISNLNTKVEIACSRIVRVELTHEDSGSRMHPRHNDILDLIKHLIG